ncbi:MAG: DUF4923 family protein [Bacteroidia bacterium]|nr:DUF4923 family protein [Bacteroidia bacterium]
MKKLFYFVCVLSVALLIACAGGPDKNIIGTWKCDGVEISNLDEVINQTLATVPDSLKEAAKKQAEESYKQSFEKMKGVLTMTFKEDKSYESTFDNKTDKGTWAISEDGKTLTTKMESAGKEEKLNLDELTDNKLVISGDHAGSKMKMSFTK